MKTREEIDAMVIQPTNWRMAPEPIPPPPAGYRLLRAGEVTQHGDLGFMVWDRGRRAEWCELRAGHVLNVPIERPGRVARKQ